jgi:hypothetical protein
MRVPLVGEGKRGAGYRFGFAGKWAMGFFWSWARLFPPGPFYIFISSFLFSFSVFFIPSYPFSNLTQIEPNQLCKVSKIQNNHTEQ